MAKEQKRSTLYLILGKIGDILLIPILLLAFFTSIMIFNQQKTHSVPMLFGIGLARVLSGSMSEYCDVAQRNFEVGDRVFIKKTTSLKVGDVIAFYDYYDTVDTFTKFDLTKVEQKEEPKKDKDGNIITNEEGNIVYKTNYYSPITDENGNVIFNQLLLDSIKTTQVGSNFIVDGIEYKKQAIPENRVTISQIQDKKISVKFHQIVQIKVDATGTLFYVTKGTHNASTDSTYIRSDLVVGKYVNTPKWISSVLSWMSSSMGMICLVCIPLGLLCILETLSLIEQVNFMMIEKKLLNGTAYWQDKEVQRLLKTDEMEKIVRIIYYANAPKEDREELRDVLWFTKGKLTKKETIENQKVAKSWEILEKQGKREYLIYWKNNLKNKWDIKQIENELNDLTFNEILK